MAKKELVTTEAFLKLRDQYYNRKILFTIGIEENQKICGGRVIGLAINNRSNVKVLSYLNDIPSEEEIVENIPPYCHIVEVDNILITSSDNGRETYNYLLQLYQHEKGRTNG